jgi:hypothetical protein
MRVEGHDGGLQPQLSCAPDYGLKNEAVSKVDTIEVSDA